MQIIFFFNFTNYSSNVRNVHDVHKPTLLSQLEPMPVPLTMTYSQLTQLVVLLLSAQLLITKTQAVELVMTLTPVSSLSKYLTAPTQTL